MDAHTVLGLRLSQTKDLAYPEMQKSQLTGMHEGLHIPWGQCELLLVKVWIKGWVCAVQCGNSKSRTTTEGWSYSGQVV